MNYSKIANFFFELGMLKREKHNGFKLVGVHHDLGSLADHTMRASLIGAVLASFEGVDVNKVAMMLLIHDVPEARIGDHHKLAARYMETKTVERDVFIEQIAHLPGSLKKEWLALYDEKHERTTREGIVAQDADWLEGVISAREFQAQGYTGLEEWLNNTKAALETESAKQLFTEIEKQQPHDWWKGLKQMTYKKLL